MQKLIIFFLAGTCLFSVAQLPPPPASVAEVTAGTDGYKYVTPLALAGAGVSGSGGGTAYSNVYGINITGNTLYTNDTAHYAQVSAPVQLSNIIGGLLTEIVYHVDTNSSGTMDVSQSVLASRSLAVDNTLGVTVQVIVPPYARFAFTNGFNGAYYWGVNTASITYFSTNSSSGGGGSGDVTQAGLAAGSYAVANSTRFKVFTATAETNVTSLATAKATAVSGDTIVVAPQTTIVATNLLKNGVDYEFHNNVIYHTNQLSTGLALGIFDDRNQGAVTNRITGFKRIEYVSTMFTSIGAMSETNPANSTAVGPVVITNADSFLELSGSEISSSSFGGLNTAAALSLLNGKYTSITLDRISDPYAFTNHFAGLDEFDSPVYENSGTTGIYWKVGEMHADVGRIVVRGYAYYANDGNYSGPVVNGWLTSDLLYSSGAASVYVVGSSTSYRNWIQAKEITSHHDASSGNALVVFGTQRLYILPGCGKISATNAAAAVIDVSSTGSPEVWIMGVEKVESGGGPWLSLGSSQTGTVDITAQHYVDTFSRMTIGFRTAAGTNIIHGGRARVGNGKGIIHVSGKTFAENLYLDTATTTNVANNTIFVAGAGLVLKDCALLAPAGAQCISATNAQTVTLIGTVVCNQTNSPNITFAGTGVLTTNLSLPRL